MTEYEERVCYRCGGSGKVRSLLVFERDCPACGGWGRVRVPQFRSAKRAPTLDEIYQRITDGSASAPRFAVRPPAPNPLLAQWDEQRRRNEMGAAWQRQRWQQQFQQQMQQQASQQAIQQHQDFVRRHRGR